MAMKHMRNEKGVTVIAAVATLMVLSLMGTVVVSLVGIENYSALHQAQTLEAHWIAEAGLQRALTYLSREDGTCPLPNPTPPPPCPTLFSTVELGRGTFTVTATKAGATATVRWRLTFGRLTGRALAAHIHLGARGRPPVDLTAAARALAALLNGATRKETAPCPSNA